jgi:hypothetical protein
MYFHINSLLFDDDDVDGDLENYPNSMKSEKCVNFITQMLM